MEVIRDHSFGSTWFHCGRVARLSDQTGGLCYASSEPRESAQFTHELFTRSFITALLLTGDPEQAEAAVLQAIDSLDTDLVSEDALFDSSIRSALLFTGASSGVKSQAGRMLPFELRRVLSIAPDRRRCFVLRILAAILREECAGLLGISAAAVDELACAAARELAGLDVH